MTDSSRLVWPGGGTQIADLMDEGRNLLLTEMDRHHWMPADGSPAYWDQLTLDVQFQTLAQATTYASTLIAANGQNLAGLATLYRTETTLTLAHYTVARSFVESAAAAWWVLSPGVENSEQPVIVSDEEATRFAGQRFIRAMLLLADDLNEQYKLSRRLHGEAHPVTDHAKRNLSGHLERLSSWSGEGINSVERSRTTVGGETLIGYSERVKVILTGIGAESIPIYSLLSAYAHGSILAFLEATSPISHGDHDYYVWTTDPVKAGWTAHVVLVLWERLARLLLAAFGHDQAPFDEWRDRVDGLLVT